MTGWRAALGGAPRRFRRRRVPVRLQLTDAECGAACVAMILSHHGRDTSVAECRGPDGPGRNGMTALAVANLARGHGLRVRAYSLELADLARLPLPAIIHWNFNHFVVLERWSPAGAAIVDPAAGRYDARPEDVARAFTGVALALEPGPGFERRHAPPRLWRRYLGAIAQMPGIFGQILAASLLLQLLGLALPALMKLVADRLLAGGLAGLLPALGAGVALYALAYFIGSYLRSLLVLHLQARLDSKLMLGFFEHVLALPFRFFEQRSSGDLLMRLHSNSVIRETLGSQTIALLLDGLFVLGYLAILLAQAPGFGAWVLALAALQALVLLAPSRRIQSLLQRDLAAQADSQGYLVDSLRGIATIKAAGVEARALDHWTNLFFNQLGVALERGRFAALVDSGAATVRAAAPLALLWLGAARVLDGSLSLGAMLALNSLAVLFLGALTSLLANIQRLQLVGAHFERLADVLDAEIERQPGQVAAAPRLSGGIELADVGFRYAADGPWAVRDVSLRIAPGQKVALVGRSGSGKSTLARLLLGLYRPDAGAIFFDGLPLADLDLGSVRAQCGVVLQETALFNRSIRQNIGFNDPGLPLERIAEAARAAQIDQEIAAMPMGYETLVAEGGAALSGGQRQRIGLARALAHQPAILLLDEATSHLDPLTEAALERRLSALRCTRIVIAHRLSTVRDADLILVLDRGAIVERGDHDSLLRRGGLYAALVRGQEEPAALVEPAAVGDAPASGYPTGG